LFKFTGDRELRVYTTFNVLTFLTNQYVPNGHKNLSLVVVGGNLVGKLDPVSAGGKPTIPGVTDRCWKKKKMRPSGF